MGSEYVYMQCNGGRVVSLDTHKQQLGCPQECAQEAKGQVFAVSVRDGLEEGTVWNGRSRSSVGRAGKDPVVVGGSGINNSNTILRSVPEVQVSLRPEP
jgi:hypothetical protein